MHGARSLLRRRTSVTQDGLESGGGGADWALFEELGFADQGRTDEKRGSEGSTVWRPGYRASGKGLEAGSRSRWDDGRRKPIEGVSDL